MKKARGLLHPESRRWLKKAAAWRYFSLLFRLPARETRSELKKLAREVPRELRLLGQQWAALPLKASEAEYHRVLGAGGIPAVESSYDDNALAGRGPLLADVRAFYEAFAYTPEKLPAELPDHIAVELDFMAFLSMKIAFAFQENRQEPLVTSQKAYDAFLEAHLQTWFARLLGRLEQICAPFHSAACAQLIDYFQIQGQAESEAEHAEPAPCVQ